METVDCAQDSRFVAGAQSVALATARHLGERVVTDMPVLRIVQTDDAVEVHTATEGMVRAQRVVVAMPPAAAARVEYRPVLPIARQRWIERSPMGDVAKIHAVYETPFWRPAGLSGQATLYGDPSVGVVFDNSPDDRSTGVLVSFVYGGRLHLWAGLPAAERRHDVLRTLATLFGDLALTPADYVEKIWPSDPWAHGGYAANPAPGVWAEHGRTGWRDPVGRIHWAGTETASVWNGYIDGAIASGRRAAREVLVALGAAAAATRAP